MHDRVEVLSFTYEHLYLADWRDAISDVFIGRAEVIEEHEDRHIRIVGGLMPLPKVVRFKGGMPGSKFRSMLKMRFSREGLFARDEGQCQYCHKQLARAESTIDHVIPRSRGGQTDWDNCVICCHKCNNIKGSMTPSEAGMSLIRLPKKPCESSYVRKKR